MIKLLSTASRIALRSLTTANHALTNMGRAQIIMMQANARRNRIMLWIKAMNEGTMEITTPKILTYSKQIIAPNGDELAEFG